MLVLLAVAVVVVVMAVHGRWVSYHSLNAPLPPPTPSCMYDRGCMIGDGDCREVGVYLPLCSYHHPTFHPLFTHS